jgi:triosephosphate isomerase
MKNNVFIANWKMNKPFALALDFCTQHKTELKKLSSRPHTEIVLCPSFDVLFSVAEILSDTLVNLGAQTCSPHERGAYTGQVSASSLKEVGCDYCIIGHSEQRQYANVSNEDVAEQAIRLLEADIEPIICIGETKKIFEQDQAIRFLEEQLNPVLAEVTSFEKPITIAYEPIWSIGTGIMPDRDYLIKIFTWLSRIGKYKLSHNEWRLVYGGSVDPENMDVFTSINHLHGFLVGSASLDFQKFEKIVLLKT